VIWSADKDLAAELYLSLQRKQEFTVVDRISGRDNVYVECCGQGWSWYGHILYFELQRSRVRVELNSQAAQEMQSDGRIEITFDLGAERYGELQSALDRVFDGFGYYRVAN